MCLDTGPEQSASGALEQLGDDDRPDGGGDSQQPTAKHKEQCSHADQVLVADDTHHGGDPEACTDLCHRR
jgi:hypothetical protein